MGRKKIQITRIMDERNRQVSIRVYLSMSIILSIYLSICLHVLMEDVSQDYAG